MVHDISQRSLERNRVDAMALEHNTRSKFILNVYNFCANSGLYEYADGGSLSDVLGLNEPEKRQELTSLQKLHMGECSVTGGVPAHGRVLR